MVYVELISSADFRIVAIVIDKKALRESYPTPAHPYHLGLGFMLQRYCGLLNHLNRRDDVMAESRGGREDRLLKRSYRIVFENGAWMRKPEFFQRALTSKELKVRPKPFNIAGLQLADLLGHPVRQSILRERGEIESEASKFATRILEVADKKYNQQLYTGQVEGYGKVLFPK